MLLPASVPAQTTEPTLSAGTVSPGIIPPATPQRSFSFYLENDGFAGGSDEQYTSGLKLTMSKYGMPDFPKDAWLHKWFYPLVNFLGIRPDEKDKEFALTTSIGQNIYTPDDIETEELIEDDRPYAGITYFELGYHQIIGRHMDTLELMGGIVGPHSYARETQEAFHNAVSGVEPKGWDNQLKDEPVLDIIYEYKQKMTQSNIASGFGHDFILNTGGAAGNAHIFYNIGGSLRLGWNIPDDFGTFSIRPASTFEATKLENQNQGAFGIHFFLSGEGRAVIRNIFLDGNTFTDSHSVDKKPIVGAFTGGIGINYSRLKTSLAYVYQTRTFEEEKDPQTYGSINVSFVY